MKSLFNFHHFCFVHQYYFIFHCILFQEIADWQLQQRLLSVAIVDDNTTEKFIHNIDWSHLVCHDGLHSEGMNIWANKSPIITVQILISVNICYIYFNLLKGLIFLYVVEIINGYIKLDLTILGLLWNL